MKINIARQKDILGKGKGYLIGLDEKFIIEASMMSVPTKKLAEKFATKINTLLNNKKYENFNSMFSDILEEYNNCFDVIEEKNIILDILRKEYFDLFKQGLINPISNDKELIDFAKSNKETLKEKIINIDYFLECCV